MTMNIFLQHKVHHCKQCFKICLQYYFVKVLKENLAIEELGLKDEAQPVRLAHIQIGDKLIRLREAFDTLDSGEFLLVVVLVELRYCSDRKTIFIFANFIINCIYIILYNT